MKRFAPLWVLAFLMIFGGSVQGSENQELIEVEFSLNALSEEDWDLSILNEFLFFHLQTQIPSSDKCSFMVLPDQGSRFRFEGTQMEVCSLIEDLTDVLDAGIDLEEFTHAKRIFIRVLEMSGALFEKGLAEEMEWKHLPLARNGVREILNSLNQKYRPEVQVMHAEDFAIQEFRSLRLTGEDQKNIKKLIKKLADMSWLDLLLHKREMEKLGDKIRPVHPLRFVAFIHSDPTLRSKKLPKIKNDRLKWGNFIGGFNERMALENSNNNLMKYVPGFSHFTHVSEAKIESYIKHHHWTQVMESIM